MLLGNVKKEILFIFLLIVTGAMLQHCGKCYQCRSDVDKLCEELPPKAAKKFLSECKEDAPKEPDHVTEDENGESTVSVSEDTTKAATVQELHYAQAVQSNTSNKKCKQICRKIYQVLIVGESKTLISMTIRDCGKIYIGDSCLMMSNQILTRNVCDCYGDGCNRSRTIIYNQMMLFISLIATLLALIYCK